MIKDKTSYTYSKHAKDEWIRDELGIIKHYPRTFFSSGCKKVIKDGDNYKVTYRYDDRTDLVLVCTKDAFVITNYRTLNLKNKDNYKGAFYLDVPKPKNKLRGKKFF